MAGANDGGGGGGRGEEKNRVKFLCSHGGKILPRPADGKLKYVGGKTCLVVVPRDINFSELMRKLPEAGRFSALHHLVGRHRGRVSRRTNRRK